MLRIEPATEGDAALILRFIRGLAAYENLLDACVATEDLFVEPEVRGHGIGTALLARLARVAVERNCGRLEWSVLDWNEPSIGFYRSLGAVAMDEWTGYRLTDAALERLAER